MEPISFEDIEQKIRDWTFNHIAPDFEFRPGQFEAIRGIIYSIVNNKLDTNILQAPTGTGKSFICIISAGVLAHYFGKKSYILASDLYLWKQYADAIDKYKLKDFGYIKGSLGNYYCNLSMCGYEDGECRQKHISLSKFRNRDEKTMRDYPCSRSCQYLLDRFRAESTPVSLLTYQLWLYQMNLVKSESGEGFQKRDVIFCDECHNIPDIISMFAQPQITPYDSDNILMIADYIKKHNVELPWVPAFFSPEGQRRFRKSNQNDFKENKHGNATNFLEIPRILKMFNHIMSLFDISFRNVQLPTIKAEIKIDVLLTYVRFLAQINELTKAAEEHNQKMQGKPDLKTTALVEETQDKKDKGKKEKELPIFKLCNWFHNYFSTFTQYLQAVKSAGQEFVVVERTEDDNNQYTYTFYCVKEDFLCKTYLLENADHKVMTSATIGNVTSYMTNIGIDLSQVSERQNYIAYTSLPNIFDFTNSPIFVLPNYKMSFKEKNYSFPKIQELVYKILETYPDVRGMINTGSYQNSAAIINNAPSKLKRRLIGYDSSKNKHETIKRFKSSKNGIIVGPSLVEGVDFPGDLCRLIIIVKLPYPNLKSPLTNAKRQLFPLWYDATTSNTIIQNIGRGVRFQGDWCFTFILDGSFDYLYTKTYGQYAPEIQSRFIRITPDFITQAKLKDEEDNSSCNVV